MDAVRALLGAAEGLRGCLGSFAGKQLQGISIEILENQAKVLADYCRLEAASDSPEEAYQGDDLIRLAAERRVANVCKHEVDRQLLVHTEKCPPGCPHLLYILIMSEREIAQFGASKRADAEGEKQARKLFGKGGLGGFLYLGGMMPPGMPEPDPDDDDE